MCDVGVTTATAELAEVVMEVAIAAKLIVGGVHETGPRSGVWRGALTHLHLSAIPKQ